MRHAAIVSSHGDIHAAIAAREEVLRATEELDLPIDRGVLLNNIGFGYRIVGDEVAAERALRRSVQASHAKRVSPLHGLANLGRLLLDQDRDDEARAVLEEALAESRRHQVWAVRAIVLGALGEIDRREGHTRRARRRVDEAEALLRRIGGHHHILAAALVLRGRIQAADGDPDGARTALDEAEALAVHFRPSMVGPRFAERLAALRDAVGR